MAVNVTEVLEHTGFALGDINMLTGRSVFTVIVIALLVAGLPVAQVAFEVIMQITASPLDGVYV